MRNIFALATGLACTLLIGAALHAGPVQAADEHGYRTDTLVPSDQNECKGVPGCVSVPTPAVSVATGLRNSARFACPADHPNLWGWGTAQHEHIAVSMIAVDRWTVTIEGLNLADKPGDFIVTLGCSTEIYAGTGIHKSRQLAPTRALPTRKPAFEWRGTSPLGRAPARPSRSVEDMDADACNGVPFCQAQPQVPFALGGWASTTQSYTCAAPYPYAWNFSYTQTGSPSVSAIGAIFAEYPGNYDVLLTNWNLFATDVVSITVGCSKSNSFGGNCGAPQSDPGCPVVSGTAKTYCSKGPVPVCFSVYQERCQPSNQLYGCVFDVVYGYCQPCPG